MLAQYLIYLAAAVASGAAAGFAIRLLWDRAFGEEPELTEREFHPPNRE